MFRFLLFLFLKLGFLNSILHGDFAERVTCDAEMAVGMRSATGYAEVGLYYSKKNQVNRSRYSPVYFCVKKALLSSRIASYKRATCRSLCKYQSLIFSIFRLVCPGCNIFGREPHMIHIIALLPRW